MTTVTGLRLNAKLMQQNEFRNLTLAVKSITIVCTKHGSLVMGRLGYPRWLTVAIFDFIIHLVSSDNSIFLTPYGSSMPKGTFTS